MSIGSNLRHFRNLFNYSYEELAEKLGKDADTVIRWEEGAEEPTASDIMKIKDVFGISADDLINKPSQQIPIPQEHYEFTYTDEEMSTVFKLINQYGTIKALIISAILIVLGLISAIAQQEFSSFAPIAIIWVICIIIALGKYISGRKKWNERYKTIAYNTFCFDIYENYMNVSMMNENGIINRQSVPYFAISQCYRFADFYIFIANGQVFTVKKNVLNEVSIFHHLAYEHSRKTRKTNRMQTAASVLLAASILSLFIAMPLVMIVAPSEFIAINYMWMLWLFLPIPVASIIIGIVLNKNHIKNRRNIVVGIIMAFLLIIYGSFSVIFGALFETEYDLIGIAEKSIGIDIADTELKYIINSSQTESTQYNVRYHYTANLFYEEETVSDVRESIVSSSKWQQDNLYEFYDIVPTEYLYTEYDYSILYNMTTDELNTSPKENGTYTFILLTYSEEYSQITICEYELDHVKETE